MNKLPGILTLFVILTTQAFCDSPDFEHIQNEDPLLRMWEHFLENRDSNTGADILMDLLRYGTDNREIIEKINNFLSEQTDLFSSGQSVNYSIISACITALMELGDNSSYPVLLDVMTADYPEIIRYEAFGAMELIRGNFFQFLFDTIKTGSPAEKFTAFRMGVFSDMLNLTQRGMLAELALEQSLVIREGEEDRYLTDLRYYAARILAIPRWTRVAPLALRHFHRALSDYHRGIVSKERFIDAIELLGAVGRSEAALTLGLQLGLINAGTQRTNEFDADITLAIVTALGNIGDKNVFDHLLHISNLPYPDNIQAAAREAISRLRW